MKRIYSFKNCPCCREQNVEQKQTTDYGLTRKEKDILKLMREANHLKLISQLTNTSYENSADSCKEYL